VESPPPPPPPPPPPGVAATGREGLADADSSSFSEQFFEAINSEDPPIALLQPPPPPPPPPPGVAATGREGLADASAAEQFFEAINSEDPPIALLQELPALPAVPADDKHSIQVWLQKLERINAQSSNPQAGVEPAPGSPGKFHEQGDNVYKEYYELTLLIDSNLNHQLRPAGSR
jgi:hypothetical protein